MSPTLRISRFGTRRGRTYLRYSGITSRVTSCAQHGGGGAGESKSCASGWWESQSSAAGNAAVTGGVASALPPRVAEAG